MHITSLVFAAACASAILIHWRLPQRLRLAWLALLSFGFIYSWSGRLAVTMLVLAAINFLLGRWIAQWEKKKQWFLWAGIVFNVSLLVVLKYGGPFASQLADRLASMGFAAGAGAVVWFVPIGLSFTTVQMISYLVDVSHHPGEVERNWLDFTIYVLYFPKFLSGPVERARAFLPRLKEMARPGWQEIGDALGLVFIGLVRKRLLADALGAAIPADAFIQPLNYSASQLLVWLLANAFALYNDFAGYSCIVRGISRLFGIELTVNFNLPYLSRTFAEFWNRWHISLSNWLRDYIYFPLSRYFRQHTPSSGNLVNLLVPPVATLLVSGVWHGAGLALLVWGGIHGALLAVENILRIWRLNPPPDEMSKIRQVVQPALVFIIFALGLLLFRTDLMTAKRYLGGMILPVHWLPPDWLHFRQVLAGDLEFEGVYGWHIPDPRIFILLIVGIGLDLLQNRRKTDLFFFYWPRWMQVVLFVVGVLGLILEGFSDTGAPFIYQGF